LYPSSLKGAKDAFQKRPTDSPCGRHYRHAEYAAPNEYAAYIEASEKTHKILRNKRIDDKMTLQRAWKTLKMQ